MTVRVSNFNVGLRAGGSRPITSFSDTFNRASGELGINWGAGSIAITPVVNNVFVASFAIEASTDFTQSLGMSTVASAGSGTQMWGFAYPIPLCNSAVYGKTQFAQFTFKDYSSTNNSNIFLCTSFHPGAMPIGYFLGFNLHAPAIDVTKAQINSNGHQGNSLNTSTLIANPINGNATVNGDVWRISCDYDTTPGSAIITIKLNGVQIKQQTDASPVAGGIPAIGWVPGTGNAHVINFSAGIGL